MTIEARQPTYVRPERPRHETRLGAPARFVLVVLLLGWPSVARGVAPGSLDATFGRGGKVELKLAPLGTMGVDAAVQPDGRIVVLGMNFQPESAIYLARLLPDGNLDPTFGKRGKARVVTHAGGVLRGSAMALQPDGRIVVSARIERGRRRLRSLTMVARFLPDGRLDPSFGSAGRVMLAFDGLFVFPSSIVVTRAGKIVVGGTGYPRGRFELVNASIVLARLDDAGRLDRTFGTGGRLTIGPTIGGGEALVEQPDGKLLVGGAPGLRRLLDDGSLDPSFGDGGLVTTLRTPEDATVLAAVSVDAQGRILTTGSNWWTGQNIVLTRHLPDGTFDATFGSGGRVVTDYVGHSDHGGAVLQAPDGTVVVTGYVSVPVDEYGSTGRRLAVVRFLPDGTRDASFGAAGISVLDLGVTVDWAETWGAALALQGDHLLVCGTKAGVRGHRTVVVRLVP